MAPLTPRVVVPIDVRKKPWEQKLPLHNRWHPEIPPVADVAEGELFRVEMVDWTGGLVSDNDSAADIKFMDLSIVSRCNHALLNLQFQQKKMILIECYSNNKFMKQMQQII